MKTDYKCLFLANPGLPSEKIGFKDKISVDKLTEYVKDSFLGIDSIKMNCNKDTVLIPGQFEYRQKGIEAINWSKITEKESLFQKNDIIPVILKGFAGIIYYIANMNNDALDRSMYEGKLWVYSKTKQKLQQKGVISGDYIKIKPETFLSGSTQDGDSIAQLNCYPVNNSVCHTKNPTTGKGYETCFFRGIEEVMREIKTKFSSIPSI